MRSEHSTICPLCEATCGLKVSLEDGKVVTIRGDADDPFSQGYICPKGYALKALEEDPDRLRQPMIRGRRVDWEEAFALIESRLPPLLPDVAVYLGNPNVHNLAGQLYVPVLNRMLKGRNLFSASTLDQMPKHVACAMMFGDPMSIPIPDLDRTDYLLIMGANPLVSNGSLMTAPNIKVRLKKIRDRGGKIVVLDPRRTLTAEHADEHHFLRPGSDAYFLLGVLHTLFHEGLTRVGPHLHGAEVIERLVADKSPEAMAEACGLEAESIRRLARELAAAPSAAVYGRLGTCTQDYGTLTGWLIEVVNALTGNLDRVGGAMFTKAAAGAKNTAGTPGSGRGYRQGTGATRVRGLPQVNGELPAAALAEEILTPGEGKIRALITVAGNPALSAPNSDQLKQALGELEFMVSVDCYLNETTRFADVILPGPSHLQRTHYDVVFAQLAVHNFARYSAPVLPLQPDQMDEWQIILRLAQILSGQPLSVDQMDSLVASQLGDRYGLAASGELSGPDRLLDILLRAGPYDLTLAQVQQGPVDLGPLQPRLPEVLRTPSGMVELAPPELVQDLERLRPSRAEFVLIGRRELRSNNSWMHNLPLLMKGPSMCSMMMNPQDAERLGLKDGDLASVSTEEASLDISVQITATIMPGVVSIPHGWGHDHPGSGQQVAARHAGVNVNRLLSSQRLDPLSGTIVQNAVPVQIRASSTSDSGPHAANLG